MFDTKGQEFDYYFRLAFDHTYPFVAMTLTNTLTKVSFLKKDWKFSITIVVLYCTIMMLYVAYFQMGALYAFLDPSHPV